MSRSLTLVLLCVLGCGDSESRVDGGGGVDAGARVDVGGGADVGAAADAGTDAPSGESWASECATILTSVSSCTSADPSFQTRCEMLLSQAAGRGCQARYMDALRSWVRSSSAPYVCADFGFGPMPSISPSAPEFAVVGDVCSAAVGDTSCYSITCERFTDCPTGSACNEVTGHCTAGSCPGLPCARFTDCEGAGSSCNEALGVCIVDSE